MPPSDYAELHCLSNFSFLRGASHAHELVRQAQKLGYSALALTDECSMAGIVRAWEAAKEVRLPLIVGSEFSVIPSEARDLVQNEIPRRGACPERSRRAPRDDTALTLVLLAQDHAGYSEICRLITLGRRRAEKGRYRLTREDFAGGARGCQLLWVPGAQVLESDAGWVKECFGERAHIAVELHRGGKDAQRLEQLQALSQRSGLALVAAGDVHMHARERRVLQDTLTAIRHGCTLKNAGYRLFPNGERHLRPLETLRRIYPPALLEESARIAQACRFTLDQLHYEYPHELVPQGHTASSWLRALTEQGMQRRWPGGAKAEVRTLIEKELRLIATLRYEHFFLTVQDIVAYARSRNILCQGRGSAANSAVCYCLGVTEVDPARMNLLFERFISVERNEPPDIDVDFEHERREEVIQYVYAKYGRHRAALAATVICYRPRSAIRDVGKALGFSLEQVDRLAKSVAWWDAPEALGERLSRQGFDPESQPVQHLLGLVGELVGFPRHLSQHVGGFVISDHPLCELVPIENATMADRTVIQWDKDDLEALGLLKVDCLALGMLSAIRRTLGLIGEFRGKPMAMADIPAEDPATYDMIGRGETTGVFQIESRAQMSMLPRLRPRNFYDLVIEVAIIRPGPIQGGMVHPYLRRRQGLEPVTYPSEDVRSVLERTLGVPIFQEQVMQLAVVAAGFTPGEADHLRRSMAAWRRKGGLHQIEEKLISGMRERGYSEAFARQIFQQILGFGEYGFPESHSASFALLVYVSAWLKCHEHAAFTCALLNSQPMGFYSPSQLVQDAQRHGIEIRPVDALVSSWDCTLEEREARGERREAREQVLPFLSTQHSAHSTGFSSRPSHRHVRHGFPQPAIRLGLRMVGGLSEAAAQRLIAARTQWMESVEALHLAPRASCLVPRSSTDLEDLALRAKLNRRDLRCLAEAGALAPLAGHRRNAAWLVAGIEERPPVLAPAAIVESAVDLPAPTEGQDIVADYASLGLTLRRHPLALLRPQLARLRMITAQELLRTPTGKLVRVAGLVTCRQRPGTASGVIFITLEDETGQINVVVWRGVSEKQRRPLLAASLLGVHGVLEREGAVTHLIAGKLVDYSALLGSLVTNSRDFH